MAQQRLFEGVAIGVVGALIMAGWLILVLKTRSRVELMSLEEARSTLTNITAGWIFVGVFALVGGYLMVTGRILSFVDGLPAYAQLMASLYLVSAIAYVTQPWYKKIEIGSVEEHQPATVG